MAVDPGAELRVRVGGREQSPARELVVEQGAGELGGVPGAGEQRRGTGLVACRPLQALVQPGEQARDGGGEAVGGVQRRGRQLPGAAVRPEAVGGEAEAQAAVALPADDLHGTAGVVEDHVAGPHAGGPVVLPEPCGTRELQGEQVVGRPVVDVLGRADRAVGARRHRDERGVAQPAAADAAAEALGGRALDVERQQGPGDGTPPGVDVPDLVVHTVVPAPGGDVRAL